MKTTKIFFDTEFTGLRQNTSLISIGLISDCGKTFYAELTDYNTYQVDEWLQKNVIEKLKLLPKYDGRTTHSTTADSLVEEFCGDLEGLLFWLKRWLDQFEKVEMWSDCLAYDWVLFCEIFYGAMNIPSNVHYIPFDICTLFKVKGVDPDIHREAYCEMDLNPDAEKHNALWDARVIKACYDKLMAGV